MWLFLAFVLIIGALIVIETGLYKKKRRLLFLLGMAKGQIDKRLAAEMERLIKEL